MMLSTFFIVLVSVIAYVNCHCDSVTTSCTRDTVTASLAQSLHGIADALLANSQQSSCSCQPVPATACEEIKKNWPSSASGYYTIKGQRVYCNMEELCGSGGWTRLAYLNMSESTENCPSGFKLYQSGGVRACGRATSNGGSCVSVQFPSNGISYSQVCGRVVGYQYKTTDGDYPGDYSHEVYGSVITHGHKDINSYYVDGVSITRGTPRQHVWTLMAGFSSSGNHSWTGHNDARYNCPCSPGSPQNSTLQSFIGNDYFCESGNPATDGSYQSIFYTSDPLWDGKDCSSEGVCCTAPGLPWFHKVLNTTTTDYLELRVCEDEGSSNEDTPLSFYELYIK